MSQIQVFYGAWSGSDPQESRSHLGTAPLIPTQREREILNGRERERLNGLEVKRSDMEFEGIPRWRAKNNTLEHFQLPAPVSIQDVAPVASERCLKCLRCRELLEKMLNS